MSFSPAERSLRARIGAYALHGQYDSREITRKARQAFLKKFEDQADPDGVLPEAERQRRAMQLRRAHFSALALASSRARRRRAARRREESGSA